MFLTSRMWQDSWDVTSMITLELIVTSVLLADSLVPPQFAYFDKASTHVREAYVIRK